MANNTPLPNPLSPPPEKYLTLLVNTRKRLRSLRYWAPVTGILNKWEIDKPFVSVMLITYNHERYIRKAIESVLMQVRDFSIEINVIDDASTDNTQRIAQEYHDRYPTIVNCYFNPKNAGHISTQLNTIRGFRTLRGRYFSLLEGDDYWTDSLKLAKQVNFLEQHVEFVACAHKTLKVFDDANRPSEHFLPFKAFNKQIATAYDLISMGGVFHLSSVLYRNVFYQSPPLCLADPYSCEVTINMLYGVFGKFYCFDEYMSAYRVHDKGVFSGRDQESIWTFHLYGFGRFALYLGVRYWCMFARAVRGFTRYVLIAPFRTYEVSALSFRTLLVFVLYFSVAILVWVFCIVWKVCIGVWKFIQDVLTGRARKAGFGVLWLCYRLLRRFVRMLPNTWVQGFLRLELRIPRWVFARRAIRDWIFRNYIESR